MSNSIAFYDDNSAEINTSVDVSCYDRQDMLELVNLLNIKYCGITFALDEDRILVKSFYNSKGDIDDLLTELIANVNIAEQELDLVE